MPAPYTGRCACGAVTLEIAGEPLATRQCWCRQCQQIAAGGPTHNATFKADDVAVTGALASAHWEADSGNTLTFSFCPICGTQIYGQSSGRMHLKTVRFGVLDEGHGLKPEMVIWTDDAPDWAVIDPALERFARQPPPPPPSS
ncbi:GFA family protein [Novosphingobium album (ex Liu et al. 2023)]|uniref:GFA family protein n=1 Tax=Novosphingobium album (ex Liu et al. 2023) TaxID=3031130 RepID=A0ABT5WKX8_9SPHN|nr:GFA family protein [Novosphingobium album (ex Liu et al. 2023)]MDE8650695.1 GFA family protein [Novosphingobium album (ex Liu et al. 2023)]